MRPFRLSVGLAALVVTGCDDSTAPSAGLIEPMASSLAAAAAATTDNQIFFIEQPVFVDCANGGSGEVVVLRGNLHAQFHTTFNDAGHVTIKTHSNPQGVSGVGELTGAKYQGTGVTQDIFTATVGNEETFINNFRVVGQGPGNNFLVHENLHITVNANGTLTVFLDHLRAECK
jgi:hypothetical protein